MDCSTPSFPVLSHLPELAQTHVHQVSDAIQPSHPLSSLLLLPSIFPSIKVFSKESVLHIRWSKYWSFSFSVSPSSGYLGLICLRMDWFDLLAIQGTLKSLLQHHSSKASMLQHSAFFMVQLSHPYLTNWKTIALTRQTFVAKAMSLLFNMLSRLVMEKAMAPPSSTLAWKIRRMEEPDRLQSMGSQCRTWLSDFTFTFTVQWRHYFANKGPSSQGYDFSSSYV